MKIFNPPTRQQFWCSECDIHLVDSYSKKSGNFYIAYGHHYFKDGDEVGEYVRIIFSVCTECLEHGFPKMR